MKTRNASRLEDPATLRDALDWAIRRLKALPAPWNGASADCVDAAVASALAASEARVLAESASGEALPVQAELERLVKLAQETGHDGQHESREECIERILYRWRATLARPGSAVRLTPREATLRFEAKFKRCAWLEGVAVGGRGPIETLFIYSKLRRHPELDALQGHWLGYPLLVRYTGTATAD